MLAITQLYKSFGDTPALCGMQLRVRTGEVVGFLGPNGAGKTTTLRIVAGFLTPDRGTATVDGLDCQRESLEVRRRLGYLPEAVPLYPDLRAREYLLFRARARGLRRRDRSRAISEVAERCFIDDVLGRPIGVLSRGYRQRLGLADALLGRPKLLLLDEPTAGLDPNQVRRMRALIRELRGEASVLVSTHVLHEVEETCDRAVIVKKGRVVREADLQELARAAKRRLRAELIGPAQEIVDTLRALPGVRQVQLRPLGDGAHLVEVGAHPGEDVREALGRAALGAGWVVRELQPMAETLEEVFVQATADSAELPIAAAPPPHADRQEATDAG